MESDDKALEEAFQEAAENGFAFKAEDHEVRQNSKSLNGRRSASLPPSKQLYPIGIRSDPSPATASVEAGEHSFVPALPSDVPMGRGACQGKVVANRFKFPHGTAKAELAFPRDNEAARRLVIWSV